MIHVLLWLLATLDAMFAGYRDAAGRCALIDKRRYYRRALLRGALAGQVVVVSVGLVIALLYVLSPQPDQLMRAPPGRTASVTGVRAVCDGCMCGVAGARHPFD